MIKLINLNCAKTKTKIVNKTEKLQLLQNSKTKILPKFNNLNCNPTQKLQLGQNTNQRLKNLENYKFDKIQQLKL